MFFDAPDESSAWSTDSSNDDTRRFVVFSDWDDGCSIGACFDEVRFDGVETFSIDTFEADRFRQKTHGWLTSGSSMFVVVLPLAVGEDFLDERCFLSSALFGVGSAREKLFDVLIRGLEGNRGTGETGGESKC